MYMLSHMCMLCLSYLYLYKRLKKNLDNITYNREQQNSNYNVITQEINFLKNFYDFIQFLFIWMHHLGWFQLFTSKNIMLQYIFEYNIY